MRADRPPLLSATAGTAWPLRNAWNRATENLFSAWIEKLFDDPIDAAPSWPALHEVLRDRSRNMLFNHLGLGEDEMKMVLRPDCADLPYFLRAYFAFKMGLPAGYSKCSRGGAGRPPQCTQWFSIQNRDVPRPAEQTSLPGSPAANASAQLVAAPPQAARACRVVRPIFADARRRRAFRLRTDAGRRQQHRLLSGLAQGRDAAARHRVSRSLWARSDDRAARRADRGSAGVILAVDGQPDGTVARKRFWRGNFLYAQDPALGGPGFKRFRPIVLDKSGTLRRLSNDEIAKNPQYADFSLEPSRLGVEDFYDRMDDVMSPSPLDPLGAMKEAIISLDEQVRTRVTSVENGRKYPNSGKGEASMPDGPAIFETNGAWEDFATPSRDLRLLIAIDVVRSFPDRVARRPDRYAMPRGKSVADVKAELQSVLASELANRKFSYLRSDGSSWTLTIKDVLDRAADLEMAYNVNDCVELRWGASARSDEAATCKRYAPGAQRTKMTKYRAWFHERRRPPRA